MSFRLLNIVFFLAVYLPLEDFILKWIPVSDAVFLLLRQIPDALVLATVFYVLLWRAITLRPLRTIDRCFDLLLAGFLAWGLFSAALNHIPPFAAFIELKGILRYILFAYVVVLMRPDEEDLRLFLKCISIGIAIQMALGIAQLLGGNIVRDLLAGRETTVEVLGQSKNFTGTMNADANPIIGTLGNMINYALFMLVGLSAWMATTARKGWSYFLGCGLFLLFIYLANARGPLIVAVLLILQHQLWSHGKKRALLFGMVTSGLIGLGLLFGLQNGDAAASYASHFRIFSLFSEGIVQELLNQRLGVAVYIAPKFLFTSHLLLGIGPDINAVVAWIEGLPGVPAVLVAVIPLMLGDAYWFALLFYYGVFGLVIFLAMLLCSYRAMRAIAVSMNGINGQVSRMACFLLLASIPLNCVNQAFAIRQFSFYLWLSIGLVFGCVARHREQGAVA